VPITKFKDRENTFVTFTSFKWVTQPIVTQAS